MSFDLFRSSMQETTLSQLSKYLTFKEIGRFASTSSLGKEFAHTMQREKLMNAFRGASSPLEELTGIHSLPAFIRLLEKSSPAIKSKITCLNLENIILNKSELIKLLDLCPQIRRIMMHTYTNLTADLLKRIVKLPGCKRIHLPFSSLNSINEKYLFKVSGISLTPVHNTELRTQIQHLATTLPNLNNLTILSSTISRIPPLPDSLTKLYIHCEGLKKLPQLPSKLSHLDLSGSAIHKLPKLPSTLTYLDYTNCPLDPEVSFPQHCQTKK